MRDKAAPEIGIVKNGLEFCHIPRQLHDGVVVDEKNFDLQDGDFGPIMKVSVVTTCLPC